MTDEEIEFDEHPPMLSTKQKTADRNGWVDYRESRDLEPIARWWIFTDGSTTGWHGAVIIAPGPPRTITFLSAYKKRTSTRNVGAEINGLILALENLPPQVQGFVVSDFLGVGAWATGHWAQNDPEVITKYRKIDHLISSRGHDLTFVHHGGHQRDSTAFTTWNCVADKLCAPREKHRLVLNRPLPWGSVEVYKVGLVKEDKNALAIVCEQSNKPKAKPSHWRVIAKPRYRTWYQWVDVPNAKTGQYMLDENGRWPFLAWRGENPILVAYVGPKKKAKQSA